MTMPGSFYCQTCGTANEDSWQYCARCGRPLSAGRTGRGRIPGIAFLLNETATPRMRDLVGPERADALASSYAVEMAALNPAQRPAAPPERAERAVIAPTTPAATTSARQAPPRRAPREPYDWSWLAEQQANIFLFAGAFLVVVAALIYVAYSGQAIGGSLKMSLLVGYTVAFFVAGIACLRIPRVRMAGQVFFGVSALLVPLNFVAAYNIFSGDHLSATAMWLAGSLTTLLFYTLIASTGLGKHYAYAAGAAIFSATAAACAASGVPLPWAPAPFLAVALTVSLGDLAVTQRLRDRITSAWLLEAQALVPLAALFALGTAFSAGWFDGTRHEFSHWFLLPSAALALAFYAVEAVARRQRYALWIAAAAMATLTCSVVFGARLAPEHFALALIASGVACYATGRFGLLRLPASLGYEGIRRDTVVAAQIIVATGVGYAVLSVLHAADPNSAYVQQTSWSLLLTFGSAAVVFAANLLARDAAANDETAPALGFALTLTGALTAVVYAAGWRAEYYAFAFAAAALALLAAALPNVRARLPLGREHHALQTFVAIAHAAALVAACVMLRAVYADVNGTTTFALQTRWTAVALPGTLTLFYAAAAVAQPRDLVPQREISFGAMLASLYAAALAAVFALGVSAEYYAFALIVPAIALAFGARAGFARLDALLPHGYGEQLIDAGRIAVVAGIAVALGAVAAASSTEIAYQPQSGVFLPIAFVLAAAFFALDASRKPHYATSAALLASLIAAGLGVAYAAGAGAPWYGVTLAATGIALALVRRLAPRWLDADALAHVAVITVTASWLAFEGVYVDYPRIAAGIHLAAAVFYAGAAFSETRTVALEARREDGSEPTAMPLALAWLWAAGLALAIGYVHALRGVAFGQGAGAAVYSYPILGFAVAIVAAAIAVRRWRPGFTSHMYAMALLADIAAIAAAGGAHDLALLLTISAALSVTLAVYEDEPAIAAPAAAFGFGAVATWQRDGAWPLHVIPAIYSAIGLAAYALGIALRTPARRWSDALRAAGGLYAIVAPAAGFVVLANGTHHGLYGGASFESSALYQWSTLGIALTGLLALVESSFARRGWVVIAGSGVLVLALLLELGRFGVRDVEAYTAVAGVYLLLVGTLGLWRFRLVPEAADMAPLVEVLGAATILVPSALRALHGGWGQLAVLLAEASAFLLLGAMLRRRGLLAAALTTFVVVTARVLFDAAQALPNWIIVLIAGMALLGVGVAILLGRERWSRIEKALLTWWDAMNAPEQHNGDAAHG